MKFGVGGGANSYRGDRSEDRYLALERDAGAVLLCVADGVGGRPGGGEASSLAVRLVRDHHAAIGAQDVTGWQRLITYIDREIADDEGAGETTLTLAIVTEPSVIIASAGDSEAWRIPADAALLPEKLTAGQDRRPFVGSGSVFPFAQVFRALESGETLVVATDGLFQQASESSIVSAARIFPLDRALSALIEAARGKVSRELYDDIAVIVCRLSL